MAGKEGDFGVPIDLLKNLISAFQNIVSALDTQRITQEKAAVAAKAKAAKAAAKAAEAAKAKKAKEKRGGV